jgi:hypothetical protein
MKYLKLIPFLFLFSCAATDLGRTGYLITDYDSQGKVEKTYFVKDYEVLGDSVEFKFDNLVKSVQGSFKIEKLTN